MVVSPPKVNSLIRKRKIIEPTHQTVKSSAVNEMLARCLAYGGRLLIMALPLPPLPHKLRSSPTCTKRQDIHSAKGPHAASGSPGRGQPHCHTCIESALTISPPSRWPSCNARVDLPVPVAPRITTRGSVRCRLWSPGLAYPLIYACSCLDPPLGQNFFQQSQGGSSICESHTKGFN